MLVTSKISPLRTQSKSPSNWMEIELRNFYFIIIIIFLENEQFSFYFVKIKKYKTIGQRPKPFMLSKINVGLTILQKSIRGKPLLFFYFHFFFVLLFFSLTYIYLLARQGRKPHKLESNLDQDTYPCHLPYVKQSVRVTCKLIPHPFSLLYSHTRSLLSPSHIPSHHVKRPRYLFHPKAIPASIPTPLYGGSPARKKHHFLFALQGTRRPFTAKWPTQFL